MNFNIDIKESDIQSAIEEKVKRVVAEQANGYTVESYIKEQLKKQWPLVVDALIKKELENSSNIKAIIADEVQRKLKAQINALIKEAANNA